MICCVIFIVVILGYIALGTVGEFETLLLLTSHTFHNDTRPHTQICTCSEMFWSNRGLEVLIAHSSCSARLYKAKSLAAGISGKVKSDHNIPQTKCTCSFPQDAPFGCCFFVIWLIQNFLVGYSTKCLIVKSVGELRNAAPPENGLFFKEVRVSSQHAACIAHSRGGDRVRKAVLMSLSSLWLDDQWFPEAIISFKFSWSHLVHSSAMESPLCLAHWGHAVLWISPHHLYFFPF